MWLILFGQTLCTKFLPVFYVLVSNMAALFNATLRGNGHIERRWGGVQAAEVCWTSDVQYLKMCDEYLICHAQAEPLRQKLDAKHSRKFAKMMTLSTFYAEVVPEPTLFVWTETGIIFDKFIWYGRAKN